MNLEKLVKVITYKLYFNSIVDFEEASIYKDSKGYNLVWASHLDKKTNLYNTLSLAKQNYYIQLAYDFYGLSIRDNTFSEKIALGKRIEKGIEEGI